MIRCMLVGPWNIFRVGAALVLLMNLRLVELRPARNSIRKPPPAVNKAQTLVVVNLVVNSVGRALPGIRRQTLTDVFQAAVSVYS
jgi:hypothetical protein